MIRLLEQEVRIGYWPRIEFDWTDSVAPLENSGPNTPLNGGPRHGFVSHPIVIEVGADALLSFDNDQIALAQAAGLMVLNLAQKNR